MFIESKKLCCVWKIEHIIIACTNMNIKMKLTEGEEEVDSHYLGVHEFQVQLIFFLGFVLRKHNATSTKKCKELIGHKYT